jgi:chaperonin GroES
MAFKPVYDRILVKVLDAEAVSAGGIVLPGEAQEKPMRGLVLAVGEGKRNKDGVFIPLAIKENDVVMYNPVAAQVVKIGGEELIVLREEDVFAVDEDGV